MRRWIVWATGALAGFVGFGFVYITVATVWSIAQVRDEHALRLAAQSELLLNAFGFVLNMVLVGATLWYAALTRRLVGEAERSRVASETGWVEQKAREDRARLDGAVAALVGAAADVIMIGSRLSVLLRARRVVRVRSADPLSTAVTGVLRAAETLRYLDPRLSEQVDAMTDAVAEYQAAATTRNGPRLEPLAAAIADARAGLAEAVRQLDSSSATAPVRK